MTGSSDPRRPVNVDAHIPLLGEQRLAGVQTNTDTEPARAESLLRVPGSRKRVPRPPERDEERITLRVHLNPPCRANASRNTRRCSSSTSAYASPSSCSNFVDPSTSVNRKVTVPEGRSRRTGVMMRDITV
jgi:hypothetical protein